MSQRVLLGVLGGVPGLYVSKPGFDVSTAAPNQLLLSPESKIANIIDSGVINLGALTTSGSSTVTLTSSLSSFSNLQVSFVWWGVDSGGNIFPMPNTAAAATTLTATTSSGSLTFTFASSDGFSGVTWHVAWAVFRGQM